MKKLFFLAACSAVVLSSCSNEIEGDVTTLPSKNGTAIKVSAYTPELTRATPAENKDVQQNGFFMYAIENVADATPFINERYTYNGEWKPASGTRYYWPDNEVYFYGLYEIPGLEISSQDIISNGVVAVQNVDGSTDMMIANISEETNIPLSLSSNSETVVLNFSHILADVQIQAIGSKADYEYAIYGVTLKTASLGFFDLSSGAFTEFQGEQSYVLNDCNDTKEGETITFDEENAIRCNSEEAVAIGNAEDPSVMVLPQSTATLLISYKITTGDVTASEYFQKEVTIEGLQAGYHNNVLLTLTPGKVEVKVSTTVDEWGETDPIENTLAD